MESNFSNKNSSFFLSILCCYLFVYEKNNRRKPCKKCECVCRSVVRICAGGLCASGGTREREAARPAAQTRDSLAIWTRPLTSHIRWQLFGCCLGRPPTSVGAAAPRRPAPHSARTTHDRTRPEGRTGPVLLAPSQTYALCNLR